MDLLELFESTKKRFAALQADGRCYSYPVKLRNDALKLLEHYSAQTLSSAFGISSKSLRNWQEAKQKDRQQKTTPATVDFATLALPSDCNNNEPEPALRLVLPKGLSLVLPKQPVKQTAQLICSLIKEFDQCCI